MVAISPQVIAQSKLTAEQNNVTYPVLSDPGSNVARQYGLVFSLPENLRVIYHKLGIDLPTVNGDGSYELPLPATFIIAQDGIVRAAHAGTDYVPRMEPGDIVASLRAINA